MLSKSFPSHANKGSIFACARKQILNQLIEVEPRKQAPDWNGPNRIRIVSKEWQLWLAHGAKEKSDYDRQTSI
jgi:hypothetical protein